MYRHLIVTVVLTCVIFRDGHSREIPSSTRGTNCEDDAYACDESRCICATFPASCTSTDGSNRSTLNCSSVTSSRSQTSSARTLREATNRMSRASVSCITPVQPTNGRYKLYRFFCETGEDCEVNEGVTLEPGNQLIYICNLGYRLKGNPEVFCSGSGIWSPIPICEEVKCDPLGSTSRMADCFLRDQQQNCEFSVPPGTKARISCRAGYRKDNSSPTTHRDKVKCDADGVWQPKPVNCIPDCGVAVTNQKPLVLNGTRASVAEFPWHATLYQEIRRRNVTRKEFMCGGTVINSKIVLTAAHCVYDERTRSTYDPETLYVATGNVFRDYDSPAHLPEIVQKSRVRNAFRYCQYYGLQGNYIGDIALVHLEKPFVFSGILLPACLDVSGYSNQILEPGAVGRVAGFGVTKTGKSSAILQTITVPYVSYAICRRSRQGSDDEVLISDDKFCAGYADGTVAVCEGDSGGGLVFRKNDLWYVMGVVSVALGDETRIAERNCNTFSYTLYTRVGAYMEWIQDVLFELEYNEYLSPCDLNCIPVNSVTTRSDCFLSGRWVPCDFPVPPKTRSMISCEDRYAMENHGPQTFECQTTGTWYPEPVECVGKSVGTTIEHEKGKSCLLPNRVNGTCKPASACTSISNETLDIIYFPDTACGFEGQVPNVCCRNVRDGPLYSSAPLVPPKPFDERTPTSDGRGVIAGQKCTEYTRYVDSSTATERCSASELRDPIEVADKARPKEFPYMAAIGFNMQYDSIGWLCGGALISDSFVLGVAHCASHEEWGKPERVRIGDVDLNREDDGARPQERLISQIIRHPSYNRSSPYHDIALYKLKFPVLFDDWVLPVCLYKLTNVEATTNLIATGWGRLEWIAEETIPDLRKVHLHRVDQPACNASFYSTTDVFTRRIPNGIVSDLMICTNETSKHSCQVTGGGNPLVLRKEGHTCTYELVGVSSFSKACGTAYPGVYTRVYNYIRWIESIVWIDH